MKVKTPHAYYSKSYVHGWMGEQSLQRNSKKENKRAER
jgi:hypothetical protein